EVVVWTFLSGSHAQEIIENYKKKFTRGTRFIAFGIWARDAARSTYSLRLNKPDEIEVVSEPGAIATGAVAQPAETESVEDHPALAAIHVGRCVPVYRKLNDIRPKQLREIIHRILKALPVAAITETLPNELKKRNDLIDRTT